MTRFSIRLDDVGNLMIPLPEMAEQMRVSAYLDRATGKIRELEAHLGSGDGIPGTLMALLRERREALITAAVTDGLSIGEGLA